jgi:hypothetical protein
MELSVADDEDNATINVIAHGTPFRRSGLAAFAPTGMEDIPPKLIHTTHEDFYYYGPGGGVDYHAKACHRIEGGDPVIQKQIRCQPTFRGDSNHPGFRCPHHKFTSSDRASAKDTLHSPVTQTTV